MKDPLEQDERLTVSVEEAAAILGVSRRTAYRYAKNGDLPTLRIGGKVLVSKRRLRSLIEGES